MDYEKAYKEALERSRQVHTTNIDENKKSSEYIFPELKESEEEKIRKALIKYLDALDDNEIRYGVSFKDMRTWLEKQGEQKHVEQDTEINDLWVYIREWNDKFGRLPKDEDELAACIDYVIKRQKPASWNEEDEKHYQGCLNLMRLSLDLKPYPYYNDYLWLKSIKDCITSAKKR